MLSAIPAIPPQESLKIHGKSNFLKINKKTGESFIMAYPRKLVTYASIIYLRIGYWEVSGHFALRECLNYY